MLVPDLSEVGNGGLARVGDEFEPVAGRQRRRNCDLDLSGVLDKVASEFVH